MDSVRIEGLQTHARLGVPISERRRRQRIVIDLELGLDLKRAGRQDRVEETVDYQEVCRQVKRQVQSRSFRLVEAMAEFVAGEVLKEFRIKQVRVRIRKFSVPGTRSVGIEIKRSNGARHR